MTCACNNLGRRDANSSLPRGTDGRTRSFRAVRAVEVQMQCRAQLCNANERPVAARLAHSSSSALAWRAEPTMGRCSPASAAQQPAVNELALLGRASCSIAAPLPGQRASSFWFVANSPSALLRPAPPAPRRKCSCMSHGHVRHRSLTLSRPWYAAEALLRRRSSVLGDRQAV